MESKEQTKEIRTAKRNSKSAAKCASIRIKSESKKAARALLAKANTKTFGRSVKFDELFELALTLVTPTHIEMLQNQSMTNEDRKEQLRQGYIKKHGPISKDEFTGMMIAAFQNFVNDTAPQKTVA